MLSIALARASPMYFPSEYKSLIDDLYFSSNPSVFFSELSTPPPAPPPPEPPLPEPPPLPLSLLSSSACISSILSSVFFSFCAFLLELSALSPMSPTPSAMSSMPSAVAPRPLISIVHPKIAPSASATVLVKLITLSITLLKA